MESLVPIPLNLKTITCNADGWLGSPAGEPSAITGGITN